MKRDVEVKVFRPTLGPVNNRNTQVRNYPTSPTHSERARNFAPAGQTEPSEPGRNAITLAPTLFFRRPPDLNEYDQVEVYGQRYYVDGRPDEWTNTDSGRSHGVVVRLKGVNG
ncbi:hypothetical protein [Rhodococcus sp. MEB064]|uniref:hypothetical protein n=1 Tax=Rhodococcus sp. MEB064 TaxID=1587522 RepID=UPI0005ACA85E|nr:hypothetical protein [Rhodococcus sp. MEB064]KIQ15333.1 hypothetical protein RU01_15485 [Rhodococcus sp. MEB064]